jgi:hypothetical protein
MARPVYHTRMPESLINLIRRHNRLAADVEIHISLILKENEDIEFTIYSLSEEPGGERILYI